MLNFIKDELTLYNWKRNNKPAPPRHIVKERLIRSFSKKLNLTALVETGTFRGNMMYKMRNAFDTLYSIELSDDLFEKAQNRLHKYKNIHLHHGDSGILLEDLVKELKHPTLFFLDGHYSHGETAKGDNDTPILSEINHIVGKVKVKYSIIIDDARLFGSDPAYPSIQELNKFILERDPELLIETKHDSILVTPKIH